MATDSNGKQSHDWRPDESGKGAKAGWILGFAGLGVLIGMGIRRLLAGPPKLSVREIAVPVRNGISGRPAVAPLVGYERRDANAKWIFSVVIVLFVIWVAVEAILFGIQSWLKHQLAPGDPWRVAAGAARPANNPPGPQLQVSPPADWQTFFARQETEANTYGWVNRTAGVVRVPIERAMDLVLQQGLPVRTNSNANRTGPSPLQLIQQRPEQRQPEIQGDK